MVLAGEDRRNAEDAVHSLVNQLTHLSEEQPRFGDQHLAAPAIERALPLGSLTPSSERATG
jgi:hypothetical protein